MRTLQSPSPGVITQRETDQQMLGFLREKLAEKYADGGGNRLFAQSIIARFAELIENQDTFKRSLEAIQDAHKLAMHQMQFAQTVVNQLEKQVQQLEKIGLGNGKSEKALPTVELKGK